MNKTITFRNAILASFLIFIAIILLLALQVFFIHGEEEKLRQFESSVKRINDTNLLIFKAEQDFLANELINPVFYKTGNSTHLNQLKQHVAENTELINDGLRNKTFQKYGIDSIANLLNVAVLTHNSIFMNLVALQKQRGFKDDGTEGQMRKYIHQIESEFPQVDRLLLLTIRRTEKDYLLRKDLAYKEKMAELYNRFLQTIQTKNSAKKAQINRLMNGYYANFIKLTELEGEIGTNNNMGLKAELKRTFEVSETLLNQMLANAQAISREQTHVLFIILQLSMAVAVILSIIIALVLSTIITKPIKKLSDMMLEAAEDNFSKKPKFKIRSRIEEVRILEEKFIQLLKSVKGYVEEINEKNKRQEQYNAELEAINDMMAETNQKLRKSEASLKKSISVKEKFLAIISHDVRSPLATLKGFLNIITSYPGMVTEEKKQKTLVDLRNAVDLQLSLLSNMLEWARSQMGEIKVLPEITSLSEITWHTSKLLNQAAVAKGITIENKIKDFALLTDRNMLELVFRNLISNAIKFTYPDGKIEITSFLLDTETVRISIRDNGVGISKENLRSILKTDDHFTNEGTHHEKGTGFGLLFCKEFIERNGGTMAIESEFGLGTNVTFTVRRIKQDRINFQAIASSARYKMLS